MPVMLEAYSTTVLILGLTGGLLLLQLLVADVTGILSKHVPGTPVVAEHGNFLFRAVRAHANTNESATAYILLVLFTLFLSASPAWLNGLSIVYFAGRVAHMCCYYANLQILRSIAFAVSLIGLFGLFVLGLATFI